MSTFNIIASDDQCTVVSEYEPLPRKSDSYQTEAALEKEFVRMLSEQRYEYIAVKSEEELIQNLKRQLEILNGITFSNQEWNSFFDTAIASKNDSIVEKSNRIQNDNVQILKRDDGSTKNITLIDKKNIHNNRLQVINQYVTSDGDYDNRYDVTILVNGLPMVHVELKRRGVDLREAFNQINRYQRQSFWAGSGLFEYIQIFVISNGTRTKYYSNTTRNSHIQEMTASGAARSKKTSNSFMYTSYWADSRNKVIPDLVDFTRTFFAKHTLLNIITRYCVFTSENLLLVMRPYQIAATERIINRIEVSTNYKLMGTKDGGGYIWHTTGSGKTLTSFKTAQLASKLPFIDKVLFVVDRSDLDYQTMVEYDRFEKGAANGNNDTTILMRQLSDRNCRIIITTIQKLRVLVNRYKNLDAYKEHIVIIFDECHRSQFGEMHKGIVKTFSNYHIFGFTGTPIFASNASNGRDPTLRTTEDVFGERLHSYTIVNAINDENVLPFHIDYISTIKPADEIQDAKVPAIETENIMSSPERISKVVSYILENFDRKTFRSRTYDYKGRRVAGFNSIFAVNSIKNAIQYYNEFKKQMESSGKKLKIATIYTFSPNSDNDDGIVYEGELKVDGLDMAQRDFLEKAIKDYNEQFHTAFDTSANKFQNYYKDISMRMKNRDLDLLIVVDMFLTGFDATTLNTLWVDKNLKQHGLIQAFSRTNRILDSVKTFGNIVCFRNLRKATDDAIALFGDENASGTILLRPYEDYLNGYDEDGRHISGYLDNLNVLYSEYPLTGTIIGEQTELAFIKLFGSILRQRNILTAFDQFSDDDPITERDLQDYQGVYIDLYRKIQEKRKGTERADIKDDIVFEIELVKQVEVNIDYILELIVKYHKDNCRDKEILVNVERAINSSLELRSKRELIMTFINKVDPGTDVVQEWATFVDQEMKNELESMIAENKLKPEETRTFIQNSFRDGILKTTGTEVDSIMPPISRFGGRNRAEKKLAIIEKLKNFFDKFLLCIGIKITKHMKMPVSVSLSCINSYMTKIVVVIIHAFDEL